MLVEHFRIHECDWSVRFEIRLWKKLTRVTMEGSLCFGNPSAEGGFDPHSPIFQTSFYHGTPSPADSGVMSPTTPLGSWPSSTPEHLTNGFQLSPNRVHSGPDEVHSPFPMPRPMSSNDDERNLCAQNYVVSDPWQLQPFHVVWKKQPKFCIRAVTLIMIHKYFLWFLKKFLSLFLSLFLTFIATTLPQV